MTTEKYYKSASILNGFVVMKPATFDPSKKYPFLIFLHGVGGRGDGSSNPWGLDVLVNSGEMPLNLKAACDKYGIILIAPQISADWQTGDIDTVYNWAKANLPVDLLQAHLIGMSLGGGGVLRYITSSLAAAQRFATAVPICPVAWGTTWKNVVDAKLPCWFFHAANDSTVNVSSTNNAVTAINALAPSIPAVKTIYKGGGHSIWEWACENTKPPADPTTADFLNNPTKDIFQWMLMNTIDVPVPVPTGTVTPPVVVPPPSTTLQANAGADASITTDSFVLDGTASTGYDDANWGIVSGPWGYWNIKNMIDTPPGWWGIKQPVRNLIDGIYVWKLFVRNKAGQTSEDTMTLTVKKAATPPPPVKEIFVSAAVPAGATSVTVYTDKTVEFK